MDESQRRDLTAVLSAGGSRQAAAAFAGCPRRAIRQAAIAEPEFRRRLRRAEYRPEIVHLGHINAAAAHPQHWRASAWLLERLYPERYAKRSPHSFSYQAVEELFAQWAEQLSADVPDPRVRRTMQRRVRRLLAGRGPDSKRDRHEG